MEFLSTVCVDPLQGRIRVQAEQCFVGHEAYTIFGALCMKKNKQLRVQNWVLGLIFI
jgi:hypothetical protein